MIQTRPSGLRPDDPADTPGGGPQDRLSQHSEDLKRQAGEVRQAAGDAASQAGDKLREAGRQAKDQVVETARQTASQARERASTALATQKGRLADEVGVFAEALHKAADTLDQHDDRRIGQYVHRAADYVDGCVDYLRERDASEMVRRVGDFTRRHPEVVLGGLFLAGVAAARFLKASDRSRSVDLGRGSDRDYGYDYGYMDSGRGLESGGYAYGDRGYGDVGLYAGDDVSDAASGVNESSGSATAGRGFSKESQLADIARQDDFETLDEVTGLAPISRESRGQRGDADLVPDLPREEASFVRNADIPEATAPQPGSYPPVTASGTFFESTSGEGRKTNLDSAADDVSTIGRNAPSPNTTRPL